MVTPIVPNPISFTDIRNEFYGVTTPNPSSFGTTDSDLYNLNFYRGKYYYTGASYKAFPSVSSSIGFSDMRGIYGNCICVCACVCGDGDGGG